ncbi:uncharacterized protein ASPGLDRAFT_75040 [Aspergillus glaucus CBS 516.65]|uniref:Zn(2)-C6 fungal-type domain-containing protein n=1 Tax=Aspergillus glaucus CBS 516.65 TaxID=1160497 RepID=A0A1L9VGC6_ASPGL|nr:hypothetical protein ASPGLDRAFT_75040 [Aspergillus glaucus CBS 516.65]OJJ82966.1 hypothetical protein ASPGLDRAFT_75040 [Aspergillus glaucus CBS 516.65]
MKTFPPGRRSHRKSRAGCLQCKRRKVKCDESKPVCGNCNKHGVSCSFASPSAELSSSQAPSTESPASPASPESLSGLGSASSEPAYIYSQNLPIVAPLTSSPSTFTVFDLELLHHYTTSTCYTLSQSPAVQAVWRDQVPHIGFTAPPVLHALLALSSLHVARSDESRRESCLDCAQMHHSIAVKGIVPFVSSLALENVSALFLFTSLTCITSCAKPSGENDFLFLFDGGNLSEWACLFRGTRTVISSNRENLTRGILGPIFTNGAYLAAAHNEPQALELGRQYVQELQEIIRRECPDPSTRAIYQDALDGLARTLSIAIKPGARRRLETADIFRWLVAVSDEYLELLRQETPISLVIFGYWCACIHQIDWMWWMEGLSQRLMMQLCSVLDPKYQDWLSWPQEIINGDNERSK